MGSGIDSQVLIALIAMTGGVITTYLTVKYKHRVIKKSKEKAPKDRMETIFEGYEKLIIQQQIENKRKSEVVEHLEGIVRKLEEELASTKDLLYSTKQELDQSMRNNVALEKQLLSMKSDYSNVK